MNFEGLTTPVATPLPAPAGTLITRLNINWPTFRCACSTGHMQPSLHHSTKRYTSQMAGAPLSICFQIAIEVLRDEDIGELMTVQRAAFLCDAQLYGDPFLPSLTQTVQQLRTEASDPNRIFLVAKYGGRLVGSVRAVRGGRKVHISRLMTAPDLEGRGIGGSLLAAIESRTANDTDFFELTTGAKSNANIAKYQRHGYRIVNESIDTTGIRVVNMSKPVAAAR